MALIIKQQMRH